MRQPRFYGIVGRHASRRGLARSADCQGGAHADAATKARGFGTTLLERSVVDELPGAVALDCRHEGLVAGGDLPLPQAGDAADGAAG